MAKSFSKAAADESAQALGHIQTAEALDSVYLFYGEDGFIIEKLIQAIQDRRFNGKPVDPLSWEVYRAGEIESRKVIDSVKTRSMFGGPKVVVFRDIEKLNEADLEPLVTYTKSPAKAHLVLVASKIDARRKSWTEIKKNAFSVSCAQLSERNVSEYIRNSAKAHKLNLNADAVDALGNFIGPNRALIERAFEKLTLALKNGELITPEIVEEHVVDTRERSIFELTRAISERNIPAAIQAMHVLLEQKQEPVVINGMLARQARMMLQVKIGLQQKMSPDDIGQRIGVNSYGMREYLQAVPKYSIAELYQFHAAVYETDRTLKSKPTPNELVLSNLLMSLIPGK